MNNATIVALLKSKFDYFKGKSNESTLLQGLRFEQCANACLDLMGFLTTSKTDDLNVISDWIDAKLVVLKLEEEHCEMLEGKHLINVAKHYFQELKNEITGQMFLVLGHYEGHEVVPKAVRSFSKDDAIKAYTDFMASNGEGEIYIDSAHYMPELSKDHITTLTKAVNEPLAKQKA